MEVEAKLSGEFPIEDVHRLLETIDQIKSDPQLSSLRHRALCAISRGKNSFIRADAISTVPIMANLSMSFPCAFDVSA
jgi:hypothetical protein